MNHLHLIDKKQEIDLPGDYAVAANGALYDKTKTGIMPELVIKMYAERVSYKKKMLMYKQLLVDVESEMKKRGLN